MNRTGTGGLRALSAASTSRPQETPTQQGLDVLRLFWPSSTTNDSYRHNQGDETFICYVSSVIADLEDQCGLPASDIKLAISATVPSKDSPQTHIASLVSSHCNGPTNKVKDAPQHVLQTITRLWTMLDVQIEVPRYEPPGPLVWLPDEPITALTERLFAEKARREQLELSGTIDRDLTAARLVSDHGVRLLWTSNLAEHLSINLTNKRIVVKIFEYKSWAHQHLTSPYTSPIPIDVLNELMGTYNLLFPMFDDATHSLLARDGMVESFYSLGTRGKVPSKNWSDYKYWRKALFQLSEVLNEPPHGLRQFWRTTSRKDPNLLNVVLFWISGVMVAILTIVSSVCGVLSIQYAVESRDIGLRQLELAIAQVCADIEIAGKLPQYCQPDR